MNGSFSEDALLRFAELATQSQSADFSEGDTYDFARCVRPDGSSYGTSGKCRKGSESDAKETPEGFKPGRFPRMGSEKLKNEIIDMKYALARAKGKVDDADNFSDRKKAKTELENLERRRLKLLKEYKGWEH